MITEITMNDVASYKHPINIKGLRQLNLFFGLNGVGKTVLTQYIDNHNEHIDNFKQCKINFSKNRSAPDIFVYNQDFVEQNFFIIDQQKSIFTLDKDNKNAEEAIIDARNKIDTLQLKKNPLESKILSLKESKENLQNKLKDKIWEEKLIHEKTSLKNFFTGYMKKELLFENILNSTPANIDIDHIFIEVNKIKVNFDELNSKDVQKNLYTLSSITILIFWKLTPSSLRRSQDPTIVIYPNWLLSWVMLVGLLKE
jgi:hypothetical protein